MEQKETWYKSREFKIAIISTVIGSLIVAAILSNSFQAFLKRVFHTGWSGLVAISNFEIKVWLILLASVILMLAYNILNKYKTTQPLNSFILSYTSDRFKKLTWNWHYNLDKVSNLYMPYGFTPKCSVRDCSSIMHYDHTNRNYARCPKCEKVYHGSEVDDIEDIRTLAVQEVMERTKKGMGY